MELFFLDGGHLGKLIGLKMEVVVVVEMVVRVVTRVV